MMLEILISEKKKTTKKNVECNGEIQKCMYYACGYDISE